MQGGSRAYNPCMLHALSALFAPAFLERLVLAINHVLQSEAVAMQRLKPHAGRWIQVHLREWPSLLPLPPLFAFRVTPAGLVEWCGDPAPAAVADLQVFVDASNPALLVARALAGETPAVEVQGDAALAADVNWLIANLRWDVEADLERVLGPRVAHEIARVGGALARGLRSAVQRSSELASKLRPERGST
jgi:ubiquinone biosynthesis protein UbiJ